MGEKALAETDAGKTDGNIKGKISWAVDMAGGGNREASRRVGRWETCEREKVETVMKEER